MWWEESPGIQPACFDCPTSAFLSVRHDVGMHINGEWHQEVANCDYNMCSVIVDQNQVSLECGYRHTDRVESAYATRIMLSGKLIVVVSPLIISRMEDPCNKIKASHTQPCDCEDFICTRPLMNTFQLRSTCSNSGHEALFSCLSWAWERGYIVSAYMVINPSRPIRKWYLNYYPHAHMHSKG